MGASQMYKQLIRHCELNEMEVSVREACPKDICFIPLRYIPFGKTTSTK